jgi:hypothetical protein
MFLQNVGIYLHVHTVRLTIRHLIASFQSDNRILFIPKLINYASYITGAGLAQAVQCLTTGWTTGRSGFDPRRGQRIFL